VIESSGGRVRHAARVPAWDTTSASGPVVINNFAIKYTVYNYNIVYELYDIPL
jgi:hypothetical protein